MLLALVDRQLSVIIALLEYSAFLQSVLADVPVNFVFLQSVIIVFPACSDFLQYVIFSVHVCSDLLSFVRDTVRGRLSVQTNVVSEPVVQY